MKTNKKTYKKMTEKASPNSPKIKDFILAYVVGGLICVIGQLFLELYTSMGLPEKAVKAAVPVTIIFIAALLTGQIGRAHV